MTNDLHERVRGCLLGLMIGDGLAMPVHWYYNTRALEADYGRVDGYLAPHNPHPDSILWRSSYRPRSPEADILHDQAAYWGRRGIHYHQFLEAGENTLNMQLCLELVASLREQGGYDRDAWLDRYVAFMTTPGRHRDTYVEECHRHFFDNRARGLPLDRCGVPEKHIGGLVHIVPIVAWYADDPDTASRAAREHLSLTHPGPRMEQAASLLTHLLLEALGGAPLDEVIRSAVARQDHPLLGHPFERWLARPDRDVIGGRLSPACYVEDAVPAVVYLALKYARRPEEGLVANTMLGGDNAHRGAVLGALLGAAHGPDGFHRDWRDGLRCRDRLEKLLQGMIHESLPG